MLSYFIKWSVAALYGAGDTYYYDNVFIQGIGAIWFLWASFWGCILLRFSLRFDSIKRIIIIFSFFCVGYITQKLLWLPFSFQAGLCSAFYMYTGYLFQLSESKIHELPKEVKIFALSFAVITWGFFIKDFKSFWLVHCDIGRGIVDVFGSICACFSVLALSKLISIKIVKIGDFFAFCGGGRNSLIILGIHAIGLNFYPWWLISEFTDDHGLPDFIPIILTFIGKVVLDLIILWLLLKCDLIKKLFGYKQNSIKGK